MKTHLYLIITTCLFSFSLMAQSPSVETEYGMITGNDQDGISEFLGIPFATPPVNDLRWQPPLEPTSWNEVLLTQNFKPKCPQKNFTQGDTTGIYEGNEDCLYLNIWTPDTEASLLPVMVFIHGGGNQQGSANEFTLGTEIYNGLNLSERGNVVVVTIQYRLGPLGFMVHPGLEIENDNNASGNYAVMDQILALQWIQNNIENFGGDPSKVMIFGESAGGVNVGNLLTTPEATGLFSSACIQSATPNLREYQEVKQEGIEFVNNFSTTGSDSDKIAYMRSLSPEILLENISQPLSGGIAQPEWKPVVDNHIFQDTPLAIFQSGDYNKVPVIIGSNADEMILSAPAIVLPGAVTLLINLFIPEPLRPQAHELYPAGTTAESAKDAYVQLLTDAQFTSTTRRIARCLSQNQEAPVFRYFFSHTHAGFLENYGSYHGMELFYVFNNWENSSIAIGPLYSEQDDSVQYNMLNYWVNFATTGNPNNDGLVNWPIYEAASDCYLDIKATPDGTSCGLRTEKSDFWDAVIGFEGCNSTVNKVDPYNSNIDIKIHPNPTTGIIELQIPEHEFPFEVTLFNGNGKVILNDKNKIHMDLSSLSAGIYFLSVKNIAGVITQKLVKH